MIIAKHICFFFLQERICYINRIINEANKYTHNTDIFIHTNNNTLTKEWFNIYTNGNISIIHHNLSNIDPYYLSWKCRDLLKEQKDEYDVFMYIEDDILVTNNAIEYWLKYNEILIALNYNLGFVRIETDNKNTEFITDLPGTQLQKVIELNNENFIINDINPYCAFWIYNKKEFNNFINSEYYNIANIDGYGIREMSAIGLHGVRTNWYKNTLIPLKNENLTNDCKIYHMPNNYINSNTSFAKIPFDQCINLNSI